MAAHFPIATQIGAFPSGVQRVVACLARQQIQPRPAENPVIAIVARHGVVACRPEQHVFAITSQPQIIA